MKTDLSLSTQRSVRYSLAIYVFIGMIAFVGCGPPAEKVYRVHGSVSFKGNPVPKGNVFFDPDMSKGTKGKQGFASIVNGKYDTSLPDGDGIAKGAYVIRVQPFDGKELPDYPFGNALTTEQVVKKEFQDDENLFDISISK
ncbi:MAG: hypothetical protein NTU79_09045 [Planctomycetota bacterium]|nr:hypothetical protein [Planctomycetota bacterium]